MAEVDRPTGAHFDPYDHRDLSLFSADDVSAILSSSGAPAAGPSDSVVLPDLPPIYDQGYIGSCVANACCAALRYAYKKYSGKKYDDFQPSRLFAYYYGRTTPNKLDLNLNGDSFLPDAVKKDKGTWNRAVLHAFLMRGVCKEELWPYGNPKSDDKKDDIFINIEKPPNPTEPADWASVEWQAKGSSHPNDPKALSGQPDMIPRAISYYRINDPSQLAEIDPNTKQPVSAWSNETKPPIKLLEQTLRDGFPFIFCSRTFETARFRKSEMKKGVYLKPSAAGPLKVTGGHALMAVGYDSTKKAFLIQNSWGDYYDHDADKSGGRFWMPYEWFELVDNGRLVISDYWVIKFSAAK